MEDGVKPLEEQRGAPEGGETAGEESKVTEGEAGSVDQEKMLDILKEVDRTFLEESTEEEVEASVEIGQEMQEASDLQSDQMANDETAMDVSVLDTDSGWMDSQGTLILIHGLLCNQVTFLKPLGDVLNVYIAC